MYYYPGYARLPSYRGAHGKQGINSCRYPFTTPGLRETIVDKMPCLGAHALSGTRTRDPLITSREHEPIHYSASTTVHNCPDFEVCDHDLLHLKVVDSICRYP